jgi:hypothetical protein
LLDVLKQHPCNTLDFEEAMPNDLRHGDEDMQGEWLFQQAAIWSDLGRSGTAERQAFNRRGWHYVNVQHFPMTEDPNEVQDTLDVNVGDEPPANDTQHFARDVLHPVWCSNTTTTCQLNAEAN